jgi:hypothetical protein
MIHLSLASSNKKTGPMPVSTSSSETCPDACPFKAKGCYAKYGNLMIHWRRVSEKARGGSWGDFLTKISNLPRNQLWRHNQAGDLRGKNNLINFSELKQLVEANKRRRGFTYTHKPVLRKDGKLHINARAVSYANNNGFTVNLSANNLDEADKLKALNIAPVVAVIPTDAPNKGVTKGGNRWVACPAENGRVTCATCGLCQKQRGIIVAFHAHGSAAKTVSNIAK